MPFVSVVTAAEVAKVALPLPIWAYGVIPLVIFFALAFVLWNYRNVANRHAMKADAYAAAHMTVTEQHSLPPRGEH